MANMTSGHTIYPVFLAHAGCPFQCVYCNQWAVTSGAFHVGPPPDFVSQFLEQFEPLLQHARDKKAPGELAFYGGTFTALPLKIIQEILETVAPWVQAGVFSGVRFSTRPDGMSKENCSLLKAYPIETVELGVQSLVDDVLHQSRRGYSVESVERAAVLVRTMGWQLGFQLMVGLPGDSPVRFLDSIEKAVRLQPDFVRIYPTVVLTGTLLAEWYRRGSYSPLSLEDALDWCAPAYEALFQAQIPIARMGLHIDPELKKSGTIIAGPLHPAFGYLVRVRWWRERVDRQCKIHHGLAARRELTLSVADRSLSEVIGPGKSNIKHWLDKWHFKDVKIKGRTDLLPGEFNYFLN